LARNLALTLSEFLTGERMLRSDVLDRIAAALVHGLQGTEQGSYSERAFSEDS
jgi:hypothetical protein